MFTIRFWLLLLLFVGSYHQQHAAEASPPITRESSVESDGEEVPFLNEGEKLTDVAPDEQHKNGVEKRGSSLKHKPMSPGRNFLLEFPSRGTEQSDPDVNDKLMEAMVIMETDQLANENSGNDAFSSEKNQSINVRSTSVPETFPLKNTSLGIVETKKIGNSAFEPRQSLQKGDNWAVVDKEDGAEDVGRGDTAVEEATDQFEAEGNNVSTVDMNVETQTPMEQTDSSFAPTNEEMYNFSSDAGIQSFSNSESGNISANIREPTMMTRNQRHYPNILKKRNMLSAESDKMYSEKKNSSFKRNGGDELKEERREITQNGKNWDLRLKENTIYAKGNVAIPKGTDQNYYTHMKENNELYGTDSENQGYVPLGDKAQENDEDKDTDNENQGYVPSGDKAQENDEAKDTGVENVEKRRSDNNAPSVGLNDGMNSEYLVNTSIGGIKNEFQDTDEAERVFEDDANVSETDDMNVGYDEFLLGRRDFDFDRGKRLTHQRDRFQRVPDLKHSDDEDRRWGNQKGHDSNDITAEGTRRRNKGHKPKRPGGRPIMGEEDNMQEDEEEYQLTRKEKCKACNNNKQYKYKHGRGKGVSKPNNELDDGMDKDDEEVLDECSNSNHNHTHRPAPKERAIILRNATVPDAQESAMVDERRSPPLNGGNTSSVGQILNGQQERELNLKEWQIRNKNFLDKFTSNDSVKFDFLEDQTKTSGREEFQDLLSPKNLTLRKIGGRKSNRYREEQENRDSALSWQFGPNVEIFNNGNTGQENMLNTPFQNAYGDKCHYYGNSNWETDEMNKTYPSGSYSTLPNDEEDTTTERPVSSVIITGVTNKMHRDNVTSVQITSKKVEHCNKKRPNPLHTILYCERSGKVEKELSGFPVKKTYPPMPDYKFPPHSNATNVLLRYKPIAPSRNGVQVSGLVEGQTRRWPLNSVTISGVSADEWDDGLDASNLSTGTIIAPYMGRMTTHHPPKPVAIAEAPFIRLIHNDSLSNGNVMNDTSTTTIAENRPFIDNAFSENGVPNFEREGKPPTEEKSDNNSKVVSNTKEGEQEEESKLKEEKNMSGKEELRGFQGSKELNQTSDVQGKLTPISEKGTFTNSEEHVGKVEDNDKLESQNRASKERFNQQQLTCSNLSNMNQTGKSPLVAGQDGNSISGVENMKLERNNTNMVFDPNLAGRNKVENLRFQGQVLPDRKVMDNNSVFESQELNKNSNNMMHQIGSGKNESQESQLNENFGNQTKNENLKTPNEANKVFDGKVTDETSDSRGQLNDNRIGDKSANGMIQQIRPTNTAIQYEKLGSSDIGSQTRNGNCKTDQNANSMMYQVRPNSVTQGEKMANFEFRSQASNGKWNTNGSANGIIPQVRPHSTMPHDEKLPGNPDFGSQSGNENSKTEQNANGIIYQTRPPNTMSQGERISGNSDSGGQTRNENWRKNENTNSMVHQMRPTNTMSQGERISGNSDSGGQTRNENWRTNENTNSMVHQMRPPNTMSQGERISGNSDSGGQTRNENWRANENTNSMVHQMRPPNTMSQGEQINKNSDFGSQTRNGSWRADEKTNGVMQQTRPSNTMPQGEQINRNSDLGSQTRNENWRTNGKSNNMVYHITLPNTMPQGEQINRNSDLGRSQTRNENWRTNGNSNNMVYHITLTNAMPQDVKMPGKNLDSSKTKNDHRMSNEGVNNMVQQTKPFNTATQDGKHTNGNFDPRSQNKNGNWMSGKNVNDIMRQDGGTGDKISDFRSQVKNEKWMPSKSAQDATHELRPISNKNGADTMHQTRPINMASQNDSMKDRYFGPQDGKMTDVNSEQVRNENQISNKNTYSSMHQTKPSNNASQDNRMADRNSAFRIQDKNGKWMSNVNTNYMIYKIVPPNNQDSKMTNMNPRIQIKDGNWRPDQNANNRIQPPRLPNTISRGDKMTGGNFDSRSQTSNGNRMTAENSQAMVPQNVFQAEKGTENYNFRSQSRNEHWMKNENGKQVRPSNKSGVASSLSFTKEKVDSNSLATNDQNPSPSFGNTHSPADKQYNANQDSAVNTSHIANFPPGSRMESNTESKNESRPNIEPTREESMRPSASSIEGSFHTGFNIHKDEMKSSPVEINTQKSLESPEDMNRELRNKVSSISAGNHSIVQETDSEPSADRLGMNIAFTGKFPSNQMRVTSTGHLHKNMGRLEAIPEMGADKVFVFPLPVKNLKNDISGSIMFTDSPSNMLARRKYIHVSAPMMNPSLVGRNMKQSFLERKVFPNNALVMNNLIPMFEKTKAQHRMSEMLSLKPNANNDTKLRILVSNPEELVQILKEFQMKNAQLQENNMMTSAKRGRGQNYTFNNRLTIKPGEDLLNLIQSFRRASEFRRLPPFKGTGNENVLQYRGIFQDLKSAA